MRRLRAIAACVGLIALVGLAVWFAPSILNPGKDNSTIAERPSKPTQTVAVLDLRNASQARGGTQPTPAEPRLSVARTATTVQIYLPIGSEEGEYEVGLFRTENESVATGQGTAELSKHDVILGVDLDLSGVHPGEYLLGIRRPNFAWRYQIIDVDE